MPGWGIRKNNVQTETWSSEKHLKRRFGKREKSWNRPASICIWLPAVIFKKIPGSKQALWIPSPIFFKKYRVQSGRFECPNPVFEKILGSKRALWMPNSHVRNLKAPCHKETWKDFVRGNLTAAHGRALKLNARSSSTAPWVKKVESSLEGGAESSLAALGKNVSHGIEMT